LSRIWNSSRGIGGGRLPLGLQPGDRGVGPLRARLVVLARHVRAARDDHLRVERAVLPLEDLVPAVVDRALEVEDLLDQSAVAVVGLDGVGDPQQHRLVEHVALRVHARVVLGLEDQPPGGHHQSLAARLLRRGPLEVLGDPHEVVLRRVGRKVGVGRIGREVAAEVAGHLLDRVDRPRLVDEVPARLLEVGSRLPADLIGRQHLDADLALADVLPRIGVLDVGAYGVVEERVGEALPAHEGVLEALGRDPPQAPLVVAPEQHLLRQCGGLAGLGVELRRQHLIARDPLGGGGDFRVDDRADEVVAVADPPRRLLAAHRHRQGRDRLDEALAVDERVGIAAAEAVADPPDGGALVALRAPALQPSLDDSRDRDRLSLVGGRRLLVDQCRHWLRPAISESACLRLWP
jgi:hypothetical protein